MTTDTETPTPDPTVTLAAWRAVTEGASIPGFPEYEVRSDGSVWSLTNWRGYGKRQITPVDGPGGYLKVRLTRADGSRTNRAVHRLVAEAFLGPRPSGQQARHLNGVKTDNRAANLAWGTAAQNAADRDSHGTTARGERNGFARLTADQVQSIRALGEAGASQRVIAAKFGVSQRTVGQVLRGELWRHVPTAPDLRAALAEHLGGEGQ